MTRLKRINYHPNTDTLTDAEQRYLQQHFDAYGAEMLAHGMPVPWQVIEAVEVVKAARQQGLPGWIVKNVVMGGERYHLGIYSGRDEVVFTNISLNVAAYILKQIAYYAPGPIRYTGPADLVPVSDE